MSTIIICLILCVIIFFAIKSMKKEPHPDVVVPVIV